MWFVVCPPPPHQSKILASPTLSKLFPLKILYNKYNFDINILLDPVLYQQPELGTWCLKSSGAAAAAIWQKKQRHCRLSLLK